MDGRRGASAYAYRGYLVRVGIGAEPAAGGVTASKKERKGLVLHQVLPLLMFRFLKSRGCTCAGILIFEKAHGPVKMALSVAERLRRFLA